MDSTDQVIQRMKEAVYASTDVELAKHLNIKPSVISAWRARGKVPYDQCIKLGLIEPNLSMDYLIFGVGNMLRDTELRVTTPSNSTTVPVYDISASAGAGSLVENEKQSGDIILPNHYLTESLNINPKDAAVIYVAGDSMEHTLSSGEAIIIDTSVKTIIGDGIYVLRIDDSLLVKRVCKNLDGTLQIISDNKAYPTHIWSEKDGTEIAIIAKVAMQLKKL